VGDRFQNVNLIIRIENRPISIMDRVSLTLLVQAMLSNYLSAREFMSTKLVMASSRSSVARAVKSMVEHNIGSVIVQDNGVPIGLFTERDLLSKVLARQKKLEEPILMDVMTPPFNILAPDATLGEAAKVMSEKKGRLVVFEGENVIGIVTASDIVREIAKLGSRFDFKNAYSGEIYEEDPQTRVELVVQLMDKRRVGSVLISAGRFSRGIFTERDLLRSVLTSEFSMSSHIEDYATHYLITAEKGINGLEAAKTMIERHVKRLPLTRSGEIVGIVTARDLVEAFASSM
jgi:CBS domain-containing protein